MTFSTVSRALTYSCKINRVEVDCCKYTKDELVVLHEMRRCASDEDRSKGRFMEISDDDDASIIEEEYDSDWEMSYDEEDEHCWDNIAGMSGDSGPWEKRESNLTSNLTEVVHGDATVGLSPATII